MTPAPPARPRATLRLAAAVAVAVTLLSVGGMALQYRLVAARLQAGAEALLAADLAGLAALYDQRRIIALRQAIELRAAAAAGDEILVLQDRAGRLLAGTQAAWPAGLPPAGQGFAAAPAQVFAQGGQRWLGVARVLPGGFPLLVARSLVPLDATLAALRRGIAVLAAAMLAAGAATGWIMARGVMGRIDRLNALADRVAAGDLTARLPAPRRDDEFAQLQAHVHAMLDRIEALNRATHRLSDTIAHELRTPLNRLAQKLARIQGQDDAVADLQAEMRGLVRVFDALLDIARAEAEAGQGGGLVPVDLSALAVELADLYAAAAEEAGLSFRAGIAPGLRVVGDATLIGQAVSNLLDNAVKYARPGDAVALTLARGAGERVALRVQDSGPGLPEGLRETVFDRFTRGPATGVPGHGLGLALVRAIALRHGARLSLPPVDQGFAVEIEWPSLPAD